MYKRGESLISILPWPLPDQKDSLQSDLPCPNGSSTRSASCGMERTTKSMSMGSASGKPRCAVVVVGGWMPALAEVKGLCGRVGGIDIGRLRKGDTGCSMSTRCGWYLHSVHIAYLNDTTVGWLRDGVSELLTHQISQNGRLFGELHVKVQTVAVDDPI